MSEAATPDTVVLIHGVGLTSLSWEHWVGRYQQAGMKVVTPSYPGIGPGEAGVDAIRRDPSPLAGLSARDVFNHLRELIAALPTQPIIVGHSFGGAFVQLLLDAGLGAAGISINGAPVRGINTLPPSEIRSALPFLSNPANRGRAVAFTERHFNYAVTNNLTPAQSKEVYDRYVVPVSGRMIFQAAFAQLAPRAATRIDFANGERAPLLFIAGGNDHFLPAAVQRSNYRRHLKRSRATTAFKLFDGRSHYTCGEAGWEAVADLALEWALNPTGGELG